MAQAASNYDLGATLRDTSAYVSLAMAALCVWLPLSVLRDVLDERAAREAVSPADPHR